MHRNHQSTATACRSNVTLMQNVQNHSSEVATVELDTK